MSVLNQKTIKEAIVFDGVGLHSGEGVQARHLLWKKSGAIALDGQRHAHGGSADLEPR